MKEENIRQKLNKFINYGCGLEYLINFEQEVLDSNDPDLSVWFAASVPGANIKAHEEVVCNSKDCSIMMTFASLIPNANFDNIGNYVICFGCAREIYLYAKEFGIENLTKYIDALANNFNKDSYPMSVGYVFELVELENKKMLKKH